MFRMRGKELGCGAQQPRLLGRAHRAQCAATVRSRARTHLDKHQRGAIQHDQVDLAMAAAHIARQQAQARPFEFGQGRAFAGGAKLLARRGRARRARHQGAVAAEAGVLLSVPVAGVAAPLTKCTQIGVRWT